MYGAKCPNKLLNSTVIPGTATIYNLFNMVLADRVYHARTHASLKNTPFSRILDEKNTPFSTEIADFEAQ